MSLYPPASKPDTSILQIPPPFMPQNYLRQPPNEFKSIFVSFRFSYLTFDAHAPAAQCIHTNPPKALLSSLRCHDPCSTHDEKKGHAEPSVSFVPMIPDQCNFIHQAAYQFIVRMIERMMNNAASTFVIFSSVPSIERPLFFPQ